MKKIKKCEIAFSTSNIFKIKLKGESYSRKLARGDICSRVVIIDLTLNLILPEIQKTYFE